MPANLDSDSGSLEGLVGVGLGTVDTAPEVAASPDPLLDVHPPPKTTKIATPRMRLAFFIPNLPSAMSLKAPLSAASCQLPAQDASGEDAEPLASGRDFEHEHTDDKFTIRIVAMVQDETERRFTVNRHFAFEIGMALDDFRELPKHF